MLSSKKVWGITDLCVGSMGRRMLMRLERKFGSRQSPIVCIDYTDRRELVEIL